MSAEEILSLRMGLGRRPKRRPRGHGGNDMNQPRGFSSIGYIHSNNNTNNIKSSNSATNTGKSGDRASNGCKNNTDVPHAVNGGNGGAAGNNRPRRKEVGWLEVQRLRIEAQRAAAERAADCRNSNKRMQSSSLHSSAESDGHNNPPASPGAGDSGGTHRDHNNDTVSHRSHGCSTAGAVIQQAAVQIVEMFVGDFVPKPRPPAQEDPAAARTAGGVGGSRGWSERDGATRAAPKASRSNDRLRVRKVYISNAPRISRTSLFPPLPPEHQIWRKPGRKPVSSVPASVPALEGGKVKVF